MWIRKRGQSWYREPRATKEAQGATDATFPEKNRLEKGPRGKGRKEQVHTRRRPRRRLGRQCRLRRDRRPPEGQTPAHGPVPRARALAGRRQFLFHLPRVRSPQGRRDRARPRGTRRTGAAPVRMLGQPLGAAPVRMLGQLLSQNLVRPKAGLPTCRRRVKEAEARVELVAARRIRRTAALSALRAMTKEAQAVKVEAANGGDPVDVVPVASSHPRLETLPGRRSKSLCRLCQDTSIRPHGLLRKRS